MRNAPAVGGAAGAFVCERPGCTGSSGECRTAGKSLFGHDLGVNDDL